MDTVIFKNDNVAFWVCEHSGMVFRVDAPNTKNAKTTNVTDENGEIVFFTDEVFNSGRVESELKKISDKYAA